MQEFLDSLSSKYLAMAAGALMSALFASDLSKLQRLLAFGSGLFVAAVCTDPLLSYLELGAGWVNVVAGGLALSGNNLVKWVLRISKDPGQILARFKGAGK
ncbi:hypothetical protein [uncultured Cohaesibacter sp.]|uniref:hypothetical protein n=1 Tax=uncultured Cohaesibacter sp. TaxID=1002546 RepID=UPI002AABA623|nr:hypothetical protein [uncultured Cohaesibacter sp.]